MKSGNEIRPHGEATATTSGMRTSPRLWSYERVLARLGLPHTYQDQVDRAFPREAIETLGDSLVRIARDAAKRKDTGA